MSICFVVNSPHFQFLHWPRLHLATYRFNSRFLPTECQQSSSGPTQPAQRKLPCSPRAKPPPQPNTPWPPSRAEQRGINVLTACDNEPKHGPHTGITPPFPNRYYLEMARAQSDLSGKMFPIYRALRCDVPGNRHMAHGERL